ncbi:MAG: hypothetical protein ACYC05_14150 [Sulfuricella sp.]
MNTPFALSSPRSGRIEGLAVRQPRFLGLFYRMNGKASRLNSPATKKTLRDAPKNFIIHVLLLDKSWRLPVLRAAKPQC